MSDDLCFLIAVLSGNGLLWCGLKVKRGDLPPDAFEYYYEYRDELHAMLPKHVRECGPIVEIRELFEVKDLTK